MGPTVIPVLVATSIKEAACIKQACIQFPKQTYIELYLYWASTCLKQVDFDYPLDACWLFVRCGKFSCDMA